jgi:hypothetical protein
MAALLLCVAAAERASARTVVRIPDAAVVDATPGGPPLTARGVPVTEHGSAWVVRRHGSWLAIPTILRRGRGLAWFRRTSALRLTRTRLLVRVDLSQRRMRVTRGGRPDGRRRCRAARARRPRGNTGHHRALKRAASLGPRLRVAQRTDLDGLECAAGVGAIGDVRGS